ncbi:MAG: hypothetical protein K6E10_01530 [Eubacterium sp.]|nr:hypothetical protein [Eubacterium sp.]
MKAIKMKTISIISALFAVCVFLTSCSVNGSNPEYLLEGASDNGFVASYRAYFAIENKSVTEISKTKYENFIYKDKEDHYKIVPQVYYSFEVNAKTKDPSDWEYEQSKYNDETYDIDILKNQLLDMGISYEGEIDIQITEFDEYYLIEVTSLDDNNTIIDSKYAIFNNGEKLSMADDIDLSSISDIYKYN